MTSSLKKRLVRLEEHYTGAAMLAITRKRSFLDVVRQTFDRSLQLELSLRVETKITGRSPPPSRRLLNFWRSRATISSASAGVIRAMRRT